MHNRRAPPAARDIARGNIFQEGDVRTHPKLIILGKFLLSHPIAHTTITRCINEEKPGGINFILFGFQNKRDCQIKNRIQVTDRTVIIVRENYSEA